jgi:AraC-like DNA-binding protein
MMALLCWVFHAAPSTLLAQESEMNDPLSDILTILHAQGALSTGLYAGGDWSVRVAPYTGLKFNALVQGDAWIAVEGAAPRHLRAGDCFLLAGGHGFTISSDLALAPSDAAAVFAHAAGGMARIGALAEVEIVAGRMELAPALAPLLTAALPALTVIDAASSQAAGVQWLLQRLRVEGAGSEPASAAMAVRVVEMLFVELIRAALKEEGAATGWLGALADARLGRALRAVHAEPARTWTVAELADAAHMSRSSFAAAFKQSVGVAPLAYLTRWRLQQAGHALRRDGITVTRAAEVAGFASESAFGTAFRRVYGCTPGRYAAGA